MWLKNISLLNFKNYEESALDFSPHANAFTGENGAGKTNLLDAIHYLSLCKSYFNPIDSQQIKSGQDWFMVQGIFERDEKQDTVACSLKRNQKKRFKRNKKEYGRLADHIGIFPLVMISPNDSVVLFDGSEERRRFVDNVISQTDNQYLDTLIRYNNLLLQRNQYLKSSADSGQLDLGLLEVYDDQLVDVGQRIFEKRQAFMRAFLPYFKEHYSYLTDDAEEVGLAYESALFTSDFSALLRGSLEKDRVLARTTQGVHKDDLLLTIHGELSLKKFGSQGQQKSFLIALKLAQYSFLKQKKGFTPLLLLDDIFDKLDHKRTTKLMQMVSEDSFGQFFLTDTDAERIQQIFLEINKPIRIFGINKGTVHETI